MPKLKTNRGAAKRFKKTASGYKHRQSHRNHILTKKPTKRMRHLRAMKMVDKTHEKSLDQMFAAF